jgi:hypothetical protein
MENIFSSIDRRHAAILLAVVFIFGISVWTILAEPKPANPPEIPFAPPEDPSIKDPDNPVKVFHIDFARVENEFPLSRADLMKITPENIAVLSEEKIDQIYGRITAGPIPEGPYEGEVFVARGADLKNKIRILVGGIQGRIAGEAIDLFEKLGSILWKGKLFYRENRVVRNFVENSPPLLLLVNDPLTLKTTTIPRHGILSLILPTNKVWLLFPAKLFCGQSLLDSRRESVVLDYGYNDEIEDYRDNPDSFAGRKGFKIREEIRMIRSGFYLGRTYSNRMFVAFFTLFNKEIADRDGANFAAGAPLAEDCWPGEQIRGATIK